MCLFYIIENSPVTNAHDRKDILKQAAEFINDVLMATWTKLLDKSIYIPECIYMDVLDLSNMNN